MKRIYALTTVMLLVLSSCQNQHELKKKAALSRWNGARVKMITTMAEEQFHAGQFTKALITAEGAVDVDPKYIPAHLLIGQIHLEQNDLAKAEYSFQTVRALDPTNTRAIYNLGVIREREGNLDQALQLYRQAWQEEPDHIPYLLAVVETLADKDQFDQALKLLNEQFSQDTPRKLNAALYVEAANIYQTLKQPRKAVQMYRKAAQLKPEDADIYESLAFAIFQTGDYKQALPMFTHICEEATKNSTKPDWPVYLAMGKCYFAQGQFYQAQKLFEQVSEKDSANPAIWVQLAKTALARQELVRAAAWADKALSLQDDNIDALLVKGFINLKQLKYEAAGRLMQRIIKLDSKNTLAYCLWGQSWEGRKNHRKAIECYDRALKINPDDALARQLMEAGKSIKLSEHSNQDKY